MYVKEKSSGRYCAFYRKVDYFLKNKSCGSILCKATPFSHHSQANVGELWFVTFTWSQFQVILKEGRQSGVVLLDSDW